MNDFNNDSNKNDKNFIGKIKSSFSGRKFRSGAYVTLLSIIVIVIVFVVNMIISKMDLKVDVSSQNLYTLTKDTKDIAKDLKDDVTIYYMVEEGKQDEHVQKIAEKYDSLSNHIKLVTKDPVLYPKFATQFGIKDTLSENSFIVVNKSNDRAKYIPYKDMMVTEIDQTTYQENVTGIDVEGKLTSAIQYVTTNKLPLIYVVQGHGETDIGTEFKSSMSKQNVQVKTLETLTTESIPKDCNALFFNTPMTDLSDDELTMIKNYMTAGGNVVLNLDYNIIQLKNFKTLVNYYGIDVVDGVIVETDSSMYYPKNPINLFPQVDSNDITQKVIENKGHVIMPVASGLKVLNNIRSSLKVTPLLTTSSNSFSKLNLQANTTAKEKGDIDGPFNVGMLATDTYQQVVSKMVVYSSHYTFDDQAIKNYANNYILSGTVGYLAGNTSSLSIPSKSTQDETVQLTAQNLILWGSIVIIIIPIIVLVIGFVITYLRRRK